MIYLSHLYPDNPRAYLTQRKFALLNSFTFESCQLSEKLSEQKMESLRKECEIYRKHLAGIPDAEVRQLAKVERVEEIAGLKQYRIKLDRERWFNEPGCDADFEHWAKLALWEAEEAVALLLGKDPKKVTSKEMVILQVVSPFADRFEVVLDQVRRAIKAEDLDQQNTPSLYLYWAKANEIDVPSKLINAVAKARPLNEKFLQTKAMTSAGKEHREKNPGGRPLKYDWDTFQLELFRIMEQQGRFPEKQADLINTMLDWFSETRNQYPTYSDVKKRISKIYKYLGRGKTPSN